MKDAIWFLLITAVGIPIGGTIASYISSRFNRTTSEQTALLAARQRRRDAEISQLRSAQDDLFNVAAELLSFAWSVKYQTRIQKKISEEEWDENRDFFVRAVAAANRLRGVALAMPFGELRDQYLAVHRLAMDVVSGGDEEDPWHKDLDNQPDTVTRAIEGTANEIKRLFDTYPTELHEPPQNSPGWYFDHLLLTGRRYWDGTTWTEHTAL